MTEPVPTPAATEEKLTTSEALIFSVKAAVAAVVALVCFDTLNLPGAVWAPVSAVVVTEPKLHTSWKSSLVRVAANLIGAVIGAVAATVTGHIILALAVGVLLTGLVCHFAKLNDALRPAFSAAVIVTLSKEPHVWRGSMDRVLGVTIGCLAALAVGLAFDGVSRVFSSRAEKENQSLTRPE